MTLVQMTRGKNVIFSSGATVPSELRNPYDVMNLYVLLPPRFPSPLTHSDFFGLHAKWCFRKQSNTVWYERGASTSRDQFTMSLRTDSRGCVHSDSRWMSDRFI